MCRGRDGTLSIHHDDSRLWRGLGERALAEGDGKLALNCWCRVHALESGAHDAMFRVGHSLLLLGQPMRACLIFDALGDRTDAPSGLREQARRMAAAYEPVDG